MTIYCIGIGGIGMSYVARLLKAEGHRVVGADSAENGTVMELRQEGIEVFLGHKGENIPEDTSLVLLSPAILASLPLDYQAAQERHIEMKTWQEYIGEKTKNMKTIAVCGAHGKSTTTAMVGLMLMHAGYDPTILVGTKLKELDGKNIRLGKSEWLVIEADEFNDNFLNYYPTYVLLTSYEPDHLDYFKTPERYEESFIEFLSRVPKDGQVFFHDNEQSKILLSHVSAIPAVCTKNEVAYMLQVPGKHNRENAALVEALGEALHINADVVEEALKAFSGTWRRQERKGITKRGALVYDDYGHHPSEVKATLAGFREAFLEKKILCIFQPHQYSRTKTFLHEFAHAFSDADVVLIPNIYASRDTEEDKKSVSAEILVAQLKAAGVEAYFTNGIENTYHHLKDHQKWNSETYLIVTMGAGDITLLSDWLVTGK